MRDPQPSDAFYLKRLEEEIASGEPELALLTSLIRAGGVGVDVGANQGVYAFAMLDVCSKVHAFEANPAMADFAARMLSEDVSVHRVALSNTNGTATFYVPLADDGAVLHLAGNLKNSHAQFTNQNKITVPVATLDSFGLRGLTLLKVDVEGSELEVLEGARETIVRDRPVLILELLSGTYSDPATITRQVCTTYGYDAFVMHAGERLDALTIIASLGSNTTWGSKIATRNVMFIAK